MKKEAIYKGKNFFKPKKLVIDRVQLYTRLRPSEMEIINNYVKNHYKYNKAIWIRNAILNQIKHDLEKL